MSITNRVSEPADGQRQAPEEEPCDTHQHMKSYIRLSCSRRLSAHAACAQHEDDPDGAVKRPEGSSLYLLDALIPQAITCTRLLYKLFATRGA